VTVSVVSDSEFWLFVTVDVEVTARRVFRRAQMCIMSEGRERKIKGN